MLRSRSPAWSSPGCCGGCFDQQLRHGSRVMDTAYLYRSLATRMALFSTTIPAFVAMTGQSEARNPYVSQSTPAVISRRNVRTERSLVCLVLQARSTCGTRD